MNIIEKTIIVSSAIRIEKGNPRNVGISFYCFFDVTQTYIRYK